MRLFLPLLFFTTSIFANPEPLPVQSFDKTQERFLPRVNVITGDYYEQEVDLIVAGVEPISYRRFYNQNAYPDPRYGGWRINPECDMRANFEWDLIDKFVLIGERDGSKTFYTHKTQKGYFLDTKKTPLLRKAVLLCTR